MHHHALVGNYKQLKQFRKLSTKVLVSVLPAPPARLENERTGFFAPRPAGARGCWPHSLELGVVDVRLGKGFEVRHCCAWGLLLLAPTVTGLRVRP